MPVAGLFTQQLTNYLYQQRLQNYTEHSPKLSK